MSFFFGGEHRKQIFIKRPHAQAGHTAVFMSSLRKRTNKCGTQEPFSFSTESHPKLHVCLQYVSQADFIPNLIKVLPFWYCETKTIFLSRYSKESRT